MKVVLTTLNAKFIHSSLALRQLKAYCREVCPNIILKEYSINNELSHILGDLYPESPDVLGIACHIWNIDMSLTLAGRVKKLLPGTVIILGGPEVSYDAAAMLQANPAVDYIVRGEGEETMARLLAALVDGRGTDAIAGLAARRGETPVEGDYQIVDDLDTLPFPYDDKDIAELSDKILYYESSRGCPFSCEYCLSGARPGVRYLTLGRVLQDLDFFVRHNVRQVKFVDRTFNLRREHYLPILQFLGAADCRTNFHFEITAELLADDIITFLRQVPPGRFQFEIGVQSTNPATLQAISRQNNWPLIQKNVSELLAGENVHLHLDLIAGLPYEDYRRFGQSFNAVWQLRPEMLQLGFLKLLKGSGLRRRAAEYGYIYTDEAPYEVLANSVLSYSEIRRLKIIEELLTQMDNSGRLKSTIRWLVDCYRQDAFALYHDLSEYWEQRGLHLINHGGKALCSHLADFCDRQTDLEPEICRQFLKFDALTFELGVARPDFLPWDGEEDAKSFFWRDEATVRRYLPEFRFTTWRNINKSYHLEVFNCDVLHYNGSGGLCRERTILLFDYRGRRTVCQQVKADDFRTEGM